MIRREEAFVAKKLRKIAQNKKNLMRQGLLLVVIFSLLLAIALGWFASNRQLFGGGMQFTPAVNDVTAKLYRLTEGGAVGNEHDWIEEPNLVISDYIPNEIKIYKIVLTNTSPLTDHNCAVQFANFSNTIEFDDTPSADPTLRLEEQIFLISAISDNGWVPGALPQPVSQMLDPLTRSFYMAKDLLVKADTDPDSETENKAQILFSFQLSPDANNYYQNKKLTVESILVTST